MTSYCQCFLWCHIGCEILSGFPSEIFTFGLINKGVFSHLMIQLLRHNIVSLTGLASHFTVNTDMRLLTADEAWYWLKCGLSNI